VFQAATASVDAYPPKCGCGTEIPLTIGRRRLPFTAFRKYEEKMREYTQENKVYCVACGRLVREEKIFGTHGVCGCDVVTCAVCKLEGHGMLSCEEAVVKRSKDAEEKAAREAEEATCGEKDEMDELEQLMAEAGLSPEDAVDLDAKLAEMAEQIRLAEEAVEEGIDCTEEEEPEIVEL
jgi:hypothetical protein